MVSWAPSRRRGSSDGRLFFSPEVAGESFFSTAVEPRTVLAGSLSRSRFFSLADRSCWEFSPLPKYSPILNLSNRTVKHLSAIAEPRARRRVYRMLRDRACIFPRKVKYRERGRATGGRLGPSRRRIFEQWFLKTSEMPGNVGGAHGIFGAQRSSQQDGRTTADTRDRAGPAGTQRKIQPEDPRLDAPVGLAVRVPCICSHGYGPFALFPSNSTNGRQRRTRRSVYGVKWTAVKLRHLTCAGLHLSRSAIWRSAPTKNRRSLKILAPLVPSTWKSIGISRYAAPPPPSAAEWSGRPPLGVSRLLAR